MKASIDWMELTYDAEFSVPLFDLATYNVEILRSLHQQIHPLFPLRAKDLHAFGGNALSDVRVRATVLEGNGTVEVSAERVSLRLGGLRGVQDIAVGKDCFKRVEKALRTVLPKVEIAGVTARSSLSLQLGDGSVVARDFLRQVVHSGIVVDLTGLGNAVLCPCINLEVRNEDEGWRAVLHAYDNTVVQSSIIASCSITNRFRPDRHPYEEDIDRLRRLLQALLEGLDIKMVPIPTNSGMS